MELRILGAHQWESTTHKCACALIDGRIAIDAGSLCSTLSLAEQAGVGAVLLSHYHLDHVKDFGALAFHTADIRTLQVFGSSVVRDTLTTAITHSGIWLDLEAFPNETTPAVRWHLLDSGARVDWEGYSIRAVPVAHSVPCTGFEVADASGRRLFYTSDTSPGWTASWGPESPRIDVLVTEVTYADRMAELASRVSHQTPATLELALTQFRARCGYLPRVVVTHVQPPHEVEVRSQVAVVAARLGADITVSHEHDRFDV